MKWDAWLRLCAPFAALSSSPHAVKPLATTLPADEKRTEGRSVLATRLEKLKSTIHPGRSSMLSEQETDRRKVSYHEDAKMPQYCPQRPKTD